MKIGILTFHWATNYGAVLQAYALQTYLSRIGHEVEIINYRPRNYEKTLLGCFITKRPWHVFGNVKEYAKECRLDQFRKRYLWLSRRYRSSIELRNNPPQYDIYICGSDQVWNPSFTSAGEGKVTLSYFLDFAPKKSRLIAYAVSLGCTEYPQNLLKLLSPYLMRFNAISVREDSACRILRDAGVEKVVVMPDPTLLLREADYKLLMPLSEQCPQRSIFTYVLHDGQTVVNNAIRQVRCQLRNRLSCNKSLELEILSLEDWLAHIRNSALVITNSYHGMVFSILFRKPFIVALVEGAAAGMNDRIYTLLKMLGLQDHILNNSSGKLNTDILLKPIDWDNVSAKLETIRSNATGFLKSALSS